jgi:hypothetical protein
MATFIVARCQYTEITKEHLLICQTLTYGTAFCLKHQWAADEIDWLEKNINMVEASISGDEDGR